MAVSVQDLAEGKCFVTANYQVRRIIEMNGSELLYIARGRKASMPWGPHTKVAADKFADDVDREVSCHYDPDYDGNA